MSKATALAMLTGDPNAGAAAKPGLITPDVNPNTSGAPVSNGVAIADGVGVESVVPSSAPKDEVTASRLAIIAKREAAFQKQQEDFKREREEWTSKEKAEADAYRKRGKEFDDLFAKDKRAALKMIGLSDTDIINIMAGEEVTAETPEAAARRIAQEESQKLRDELAAEKESIKKEHNAFLIQRLKTDIESTIKTQADKYEYTAFEGAEGELQVYAFIEEDLKLNKDTPDYKMLTVEQALDLAEEYYEDRDKALEAASKKRKARIAAAASPPAPGTSTPAVQAARGASAGTAPASNAKPTRSPTLTNEVSATGAAIANSRAVRRETEEQKKARIIAKINRGEY